MYFTCEKDMNFKMVRERMLWTECSSPPTTKFIYVESLGPKVMISGGGGN